MKLKQTTVRKMFPKHTIVFGVEETLFYAKADKKKETVVARIAAMSNDSLRIFVPMGRAQTLKAFANINLMKGGRAAIRRGLKADAVGGAVITESMVDTCKSIAERTQYEVALELLRTHWNGGVDVTNWDFLTAPAKHEFHYTGKKKPAAVSPVQQLAETLAKRPRGSKIPQPDEKLTQKTIKDTMKAAEKKPRKPRAKKVTEGQALLMAAGATFDGNGKMHTPKATPPAAEPVRARKPRTSPAKAPNSAKATKAVPEQGKWSEDDDAYFVSVMDSAAAMTRRLQEVEDARRKGISVAEYDKKLEAARKRRNAKK